MLQTTLLVGTVGLCAPPPLSRRAVLRGAPPLTALSRPAVAQRSAVSCSTVDYRSTTVTAGTAVDYRSTTVTVGTAAVPVSIWSPPSASSSVTPLTYDYRIDLGRIAAKLKVGWLGWLPAKSYKLACAGAAAPEAPTAKPGDAILFTHGFLGSRFDMAHVCEALAAAGFTVLAPELPESLAASFTPDGEAGSRAAIVAATRSQLLPDAQRWGVFGHSAGAGTVLTLGGAYALGRAALAPGFRGFDGDDPLFLVSSEADGCDQLLKSSGVDIAESIEADAKMGRPTDIVADPRLAFAGSAGAARRCALLYSPTLSTRLAQEGAPLPCHISFLWEGVNDAMIDFLAPLLPLAKGLGLFVLDFDVYMGQRDSARVADDLVPALLRFYGRSAASTDET